MTVIAIAGAGLQGLLLQRYRLECAPAVRVDSTAAWLTSFPGDQLAPTRSGSLSFGGMWMAPLSWHVAKLGPKWHCMRRSSTTENSTCWVTGPTLTEKVMSPTDSVVPPLKPDKILPAEWR